MYQTGTYPNSPTLWHLVHALSRKQHLMFQIDMEVARSLSQPALTWTDLCFSLVLIPLALPKHLSAFQNTVNCVNNSFSFFIAATKKNREILQKWSEVEGSAFCFKNQWCPAFLMLWPFNLAVVLTLLKPMPFNTAHRDWVTPNHKIILLILHNWNFATVIHHDWKMCVLFDGPVKGLFNTNKGLDPQVD